MESVSFTEGFKFGHCVYFVLQYEMPIPQVASFTRDLSGLYKSRQWKDGDHLRGYNQVILCMAINEIIPNHFKTLVKIMAFKFDLYGARNLALIRPFTFCKNNNILCTPQERAEQGQAGKPKYFRDIG